MSLLKIKCPECNAGLKSSTGFEVGQSVSCPKCETDFTVEEPDDDMPAPGKKPVKAAAADDEDDDEQPRKKKKKARAADDDEDIEQRSYKNSPLRYAVLGVLVVVMLVLGYFLYDKKKKEREAAALEADQPILRPDPSAQRDPVVRLDPNAPRPQPAGFGDGGAGVRPNPKKNPTPKKGPDVGGIAVNAFGQLLAGGGAQNQKEADALTQKYTAALVGSWSADLGKGVTEELTYTADGTFAAARSGGNAEASAVAGKWTVKGLTGTKGLKLQLDTVAGPRTITAVFEDGELQHPSQQPGVTATFRKK